MTDISDRRGTFMISRKLIDDAKTNPESLLDIFAEVIIVRAEMLYLEDSIQYWGYSSKFEVCSQMVEAPFYQIVMHVEQDPPKCWHTWEKI